MGRLSDHSSATNIFAAYVGQIRGVMDALGWDKAHVIGHSMGAAIATLFAASYPERVDRMLLIEGLGNA